jgi:hypothetical protein
LNYESLSDGHWVLISLSFDEQIVGTSKNFQKRKKQLPEKKRAVMAATSDSEDSYSSSSHGGGRHKSPNNSNGRVQSFTPSTPPPTAVNYRTAKRRKGIPHRAPMGGSVIEY